MRKTGTGSGSGGLSVRLNESINIKHPVGTTEQASDKHENCSGSFSIKDYLVIVESLIVNGDKNEELIVLNA